MWVVLQTAIVSGGIVLVAAIIGLTFRQHYKRIEDNKATRSRAERVHELEKAQMAKEMVALQVELAKAQAALVPPIPELQDSSDRSRHVRPLVP